MQNILNDIRDIIAQARERVARSINYELTLAYWHIGRRIVEEEQQGKLRADYGKQLVKELSVKLQLEFGSGFAAQSLWNMRLLYLSFPILSAVRRELTWVETLTKAVTLSLFLLLCVILQKYIQFYLAQIILCFYLHYAMNY